MEHREAPQIGSEEFPFDDAAGHRVKGFRLPGLMRQATGARSTIPARVCWSSWEWSWRVARSTLPNERGGPRSSGSPISRNTRSPSTASSWCPNRQSGTRGDHGPFLKRCAKVHASPTTFSVLGGLPDNLKSAFQKYAWVNEVTRVAYGPGRVRVELRYRRPVAWVQLRDADQLLVDEEGTVLPTEDIDVAALGRVIKITGAGGLARPSATQYGEKWKSKATGDELEVVDAGILAAAKLAGFLLREPRAADAQRSTALKFTQIIVSDFERRGLFVVNDEGTPILWGDGPSLGDRGELSPEEKWAVLRRWAETAPARFLEPGDFWSISKSGLLHKCPHKADPHKPRTSSSPTQGQRANGTAKSRLSG